MKYDLHIHSNKSDGLYSKTKLIHDSIEKELKVISFCDHNVIDEYGDSIIKEYIKTYGCSPIIQVINSVELDVDDIAFLHVLAYDCKKPSILNEHLEKINEENSFITEEITKKIFKHYGIYIPIDELYAMSSNKWITKNTIIKWICNHGFASSWNEAGYLYTGKKSPCYIKKKGLHLLDAIELILQSEGISVMAHPSSIKYNDNELDDLIKVLSNNGLNGIEVLNTSKTNLEQLKYYRYLAFKYNLLSTCGSDYHGIDKKITLGIENNISDGFVRKIELRR